MPGEQPVGREPGSWQLVRRERKRRRGRSRRRRASQSELREQAKRSEFDEVETEKKLDFRFRTLLQRDGTVADGHLDERARYCGCSLAGLRQFAFARSN